ncbi:MAG TPA: hypothetical protein VFJ52_02450 [Terriglobia bacterium]|nr:hypothetical protein [Terriglobia bacterium]
MFEKPDSKNTVVGIAWYRRDQWPRLLEISADWSDIEDSYDHWLVHATEAFETMRNEGLKPVKVDIDTEELLAWCASRKIHLDGRARARYVTERVQKIYQPPPS